MFIFCVFSVATEFFVVIPTLLSYTNTLKALGRTNLSMSVTHPLPYYTMLHSRDLGLLRCMYVCMSWGPATRPCFSCCWSSVVYPYERKKTRITSSPSVVGGGGIDSLNALTIVLPSMTTLLLLLSCNSPTMHIDIHSLRLPVCS